MIVKSFTKTTNMKMKQLFLMAAIATMPLVACNASDTSTNATERAATTDVATAKPDLGFLKKLGVDVSRLQAIGDKYDSDQQWEATVLNDEQIIALLPMVKSMNDVEIEGGYDIEAAKAMPGGHTMLIFAVEYGDSGAELMGIYDRDGNLTDFMQLGNIREFSTVQCNDEMTQGTAQVTHTTFKFNSPSEFIIDKTVKVADWKRAPGDEALPSNFTKVHWLVQTLDSYEVDDQGRITLVDEKEVKRQGEVDPDVERWNGIARLGQLPASDPNRIERLNDKANELYKQLGRGDYDADPSYHIQMVLAEYFDSNPQTLLQWIYNYRGKKTLLVEHFEQIFANGWRNKFTLVKAIEQMRDPDAQQYLNDLTAQWGPSDAVG